jgi:GNAT superfamily N-acetyltransferase
MIIRQMTINDAPYFQEALELLNRTQGRDLFNPTYMDRRVNDPLSYVVGAFEDDVLIALGVAQILHELEFYLSFDPQIVNDLSDHVVGSFSTLCVSEKYQGKGIGQLISHKRLELLKESGCEVVLGISWVSSMAHTSNRVFEKMGFKAVKKIDDFFYKSSLENPFICPACGEPPCTCPGILYRLNLASSRN